MNPAMRPGTDRHRLEPSVDPVKANAEEHSRWCCYWSPTVRFPCSTVGNALQACKDGWSSSISIPSNSAINSMKPGVDMCRPMGQHTCSANYS